MRRYSAKETLLDATPYVWHDSLISEPFHRSTSTILPIYICCQHLTCICWYVWHDSWISEPFHRSTCTISPIYIYDFADLHLLSTFDGYMLICATWLMNTRAILPIYICWQYLTCICWYVWHDSSISEPFHRSTSTISPIYICCQHLTCYIHMRADCWYSSDRNGWVISHIWMSHVTRMNKSCHTYEWGMSPKWIRHVTHMNESCHTYQHTHACGLLRQLRS